jgi:uncharacterized membrane protein
MQQQLMQSLLSLVMVGLLTADVFAQGRVYEWSWEMHPMWWGWGLGMMFMMLLFWGLVIVGVVLGIRWLISQGKETRSDSALAILRQRYARGDKQRRV